MHDPTARFGGVDWATDAHAVCIVDGDGGVVSEFFVEHTAEGLADLMRESGFGEVGFRLLGGSIVALHTGVAE